jgi:hypothetical protein
VQSSSLSHDATRMRPAATISPSRDELTAEGEMEEHLAPDLEFGEALVRQRSGERGDQRASGGGDSGAGGRLARIFGNAEGRRVFRNRLQACIHKRVHEKSESFGCDSACFAQNSVKKKNQTCPIYSLHAPTCAQQSSHFVSHNLRASHISGRGSAFSCRRLCSRIPQCGPHALASICDGLLRTV